MSKIFKQTKPEYIFHLAAKINTRGFLNRNRPPQREGFESNFRLFEFMQTIFIENIRSKNLFLALQ